MDLALVMEALRPGENVAPDLSSYAVMVEKWRGSLPIPSEEEVNAKWNEIAAADALVEYKVKRKEEYQKQGLTADELIEAIIESIVEDKPNKLNELQQKRIAIKNQFPKP